MIKRLLPIFLSVCYVFAGERPFAIEFTENNTGCVATAACVATDTSEEAIAFNNPWSECHMHQNPPLFKITLPGGQVIVILGTTHTIPLSYILPECLVEDLIKQSVFTFNEIWGELLKGGPSKVDSHFGCDSLPDFCFINDACRTKIKDIIRAFYKQFEALYLNPESLESKVAEDMNSVFDENGKWYEKAGIVLRKIRKDKENATNEKEECETDDLQPTHLVIKVNGCELEVPVDKELHPIVLSRVAPYQLPLCGGMDKHLVIISLNAGKPIFALEQESERWGQEEMKCLRDSIENSGIYPFKFFSHDKPQGPLITKDTLHIFYSVELPDHKSPGLLERNDLWVLRIMELVKEDFKLAFGHVGCGHLKDLFEKLEGNKCKVERLSLAKLQGLLNEQTLSREGGGC
ncbi:MAG: hypothetical protein NT128_00935 [Proteobacteria bacterium]|nr:hypothetical protein [Pseudomonadota bacterium]